jgi:geranylgeranyl reductase
MIRTDVLIIGGGPAGSTAARFLSQNSVDTILAERDLSYVKPCGGGIPSSAFNELKIPEDVVKKKINKVLIVSPKGQRVNVKLEGGYLAITERGYFDNRLRSLSEKEGAKCIEAEFLRFETIDRQIISILKKKDTSEEVKVKSDYVIASDGITFRTGSCLNICRKESVFTISTHLKSFEDSVSDAVEFWFGSYHATNFYSWVFPSNGYTSIGTGSKDPKELTHLLDRFINRRFLSSLKILNEENSISRLRAFKIPQWNKTLFNKGNILFVGDAASTVMPVTYEGIYYAMKSGEFAAIALTQRKPSLYKKLWNERFKSRFLFMSKIRNYLFKDDKNIERFVSIHQRPEAQELAMRLWLKKETGLSILKSYINILRR